MKIKEDLPSESHQPETGSGLDQAQSELCRSRLQWSHYQVSVIYFDHLGLSPPEVFDLVVGQHTGLPEFL